MLSGKILILVSADYSGPSIVVRTLGNGGAKLAVRGSQPATTVPLDRAIASPVPVDGNFVEYQTVVSATADRCFTFSASWPGGGWTSGMQVSSSP